MNDRKDVFGELIIDRFRGEYDCFSNFHLGAPFKLWGIEFATSEHAYQWAKSHDAADKKKILYKTVQYIGTAGDVLEFDSPSTPGHARSEGKLVTKRPDWLDVRYPIMVEVVEAKFSQNWGILQILLGTEDAILIEGNTWHDNTWGECNNCPRCEGQVKLNLLGKALMQTRTKLGNK